MTEKRATFWQRLLANLLDLAAIFVLSLLIGGFLGSMAGAILGGVIGGHGGHPFAGGALAAGFMMVIGTLFLMWLLSMPYKLIECFTGWTPGKYLMGLQVRNEDGSPATVPQLVARWLFAHSAVLLGILSLSGIPFAVLSGPVQTVFFLGCFLVLLPARMALHDMIAKTAVYPNDALE